MSKQWKHVALAVSFVFAWTGVTAFAASSPESAKSATKSKSSKMLSDSQFAKAAAEGGLAQIKLGELAENKATSKTVKDLGQRIVKDHTQADDSLKTAAAKDGISLPAQLSAKDEATYNRLSQLSGAAFDRAYARDIVRDHEADIAQYRHEANDGKDASIKSFAAQTLPTLQSHLKLAREAEQAVSAKTDAQATKKQS